MTAQSTVQLDEEWWTTEMVCRYLKIGRKTLWERRRDPTLAVPRAYRMAGKRNLYRAAEIKEWAIWIADRPRRIAVSRGQDTVWARPTASTDRSAFSDDAPVDSVRG